MAHRHKTTPGTFLVLAVLAGVAGASPAFGRVGAPGYEPGPACGDGPVFSSTNCGVDRLPVPLPCDLIGAPDDPCPRISRCWTDPRVCQDGNYGRPAPGGNARIR